jgi:hypothetical protein
VLGNLLHFEFQHHIIYADILLVEDNLRNGLLSDHHLINDDMTYNLYHTIHLVENRHLDMNSSMNMLHLQHRNLTNNMMTHSRNLQKGMYSSRIANKMLHKNLESNRKSHSRNRQKDMCNRDYMLQDRMNNRLFQKETIHLCNNSSV